MVWLVAGDVVIIQVQIAYFYFPKSTANNIVIFWNRRDVSIWTEIVYLVLIVQPTESGTRPGIWIVVTN